MKATFDRALRAIRKENVKNGCRICFEPVTAKNGIVCKGDCECWIHYRCLDFTPGQILDLKAGNLSVKCPCPSCGIGMTPNNHELIKPNTNCNLRNCPSNQKRICESDDCPQAYEPLDSELKKKICPDDCLDSVYRKMDPKSCTLEHPCCICKPDEQHQTSDDDTSCCVCASEESNQNEKCLGDGNQDSEANSKPCCFASQSNDSQVFRANKVPCCLSKRSNKTPSRPCSHVMRSKKSCNHARCSNDSLVSQASNRSICHTRRLEKSSREKKYNSKFSNYNQVSQANDKPYQASRSEKFTKQGTADPKAIQVKNNRDTVNFVNKKISCHTDEGNNFIQSKNFDDTQTCRKKSKIPNNYKSVLKNSIRGMLSPLSQMACLESNDVREMFIPGSNKIYENTDYETWYNTDPILRVSHSDVTASVPVSAGEPVRRSSCVKLNSNNLSDDKARMLSAMDEMYQTMGLFQNQIQFLMKKVKETLDKS